MIKDNYFKWEILKTNGSDTNLYKFEPNKLSFKIFIRNCKLFFKPSTKGPFTCPISENDFKISQPILDYTKILFVL
jgi:hypothetical protein